MEGLTRREGRLVCLPRQHRGHLTLHRLEVGVSCRPFEFDNLSRGGSEGNCTGNQVLNQVRTGRKSYSQVLRLFTANCSAVSRKSLPVLPPFHVQTKPVGRVPTFPARSLPLQFIFPTICSSSSHASILIIAATQPRNPFPTPPELNPLRASSQI